MQPINTPLPNQNENTASLVESLKKILLSEHTEQLQKIEQRISQLEQILQPQGLSSNTLNPSRLAPVDTHRLEGLARNCQQLISQESATRQQEIKRIAQQLASQNSLNFAQNSSPQNEEKLANQINQVSEKMSQLIEQRISGLGDKMNTHINAEINKLKSETTQQFTTQLKETEETSLQTLNQRLQKIADAALSKA